MGSDIRKSFIDHLEDKTSCDVLLVNVPSRWYMESNNGLFDLPFLQLEHSSKNTDRLYGDQDHEPNHGLLMICSVLRKNKINFRLLDLHSYCFLKDQNAIDVDTNADDLLADFSINVNPKIVAFSSMSPNLDIAKKLASISKKIIKNCITIIGGMATIDLTNCFDTEAFDYAVLSEGEYGFVELIENITRNKTKSIPSINNIAYKINGEIYENTVLEIIGQPNLFPAYDLLPLELELIPRLFTSRGCSNKCAFCSPAIFFNNKLSIRDAKNIISDIEYLHNNFDFDWFNLGDLTLYMKSKEVQEVCDFLTQGDFKRWWCQTQVSQLSDDGIELLGKSNCYQVAIGFEDFSIGDKRIRIKNPGKMQSIDVCNKLHENGIMVQGYWIFGTPEDTFESSLFKIEDICEFVRNGYVDTVHISYLIPYMNTVYRKKGYDLINIIHNDYSKYIDLSCGFYNELPMHSTKNLTDKEIFLLMQLAISSCSNEFHNRHIP